MRAKITHGVWIVWASASVPAWTGCAGLSPGEVGQIREARDAYNGGRYVEAERMLSPIIAEHPGDSGIGDALYVRGLTYLRRGMRSEGERDLLAGRGKAGDAATRALINAQLGYLRYSDGNFEAAGKFFADALPYLPPESDRAGAHYHYGMSLMRSGNFTRARDAFRVVPNKFPDSKFADLARKKAAWSGNYFTIQSGAFSQQSRADEEAQRWRQRGFECSVSKGSGENANLHYVHVGRFPSYSAARAALGTIRGGSADAFVVP